MAQHEESPAVVAGKRILAGERKTPVEVLELVKKELKKERAFGLARKLLDLYAEDPQVRGNADLRVRIAQQRALCTYKDPDLPVSEKLDQALCILQADADLSSTTDRETLGQAGAIYKRKWEFSGQVAHLEQSLAYYYHRGYLHGTTEDYGWTGINAAYVLEVLADLESVVTGDEAQAETIGETRRARAREIRSAIVARLLPLQDEPENAWLGNEWWFLVTLAEANFGLDAFPQAREWLLKAKALPGVPDWEQESTARQFASLLILKRKRSPDKAQAAHDCLREFLGNDSALDSVIRGKIGLALSGGGFRASLFHIGVLARLAELDLLRSIEILSCVSGGSIIGAYYYLEVRKLLKAKRDEEITTQDYIDIVQRIETRFLAGVQRNIRTRILASWLSGVKMIFAPNYSRIKRAGELYESELYTRVDDGENGSERWLNELVVLPMGEGAAFKPKDNNWRRANKVPILILNATTLNTGHNWQFTATWMGEPPGTIDTRIDANYRLRRMYYDDAPPRNKRIRLGYAVAASACVPGIFEPFPLTHLYERENALSGRKGQSRSSVEPIVRLVDGGVHDNQGVSGLLDQGCNVLLVSDACGQMNSEDFPKSGMLGVPLRSNSILQARVREAQYLDVAMRRGSGLLKGLMFIHLKQDLDMDPVDWIACQDPSRRRTPRPLTTYGVQREIQHHLAGMRTDLDSFSDAEALSLMCSGYLMTTKALGQGTPLGFALPSAPHEPWGFLAVESLMKRPGEDNPLLHRLRDADKLFLKVWLLSPRLKVIGCAIAVVAIAAFCWIAWRFWGTGLVSFTVGEALFLVGGAALSLMGLGRVFKVINYRKTVEQVLIGIGLILVGAFLARLHLHVFDRLFLRNGSLKQLLGESSTPRMREVD